MEAETRVAAALAFPGPTLHRRRVARAPSKVRVSACVVAPVYASAVLESEREVEEMDSEARVVGQIVESRGAGEGHRSLSALTLASTR